MIKVEIWSAPTKRGYLWSRGSCLYLYEEIRKWVSQQPTYSTPKHIKRDGCPEACCHFREMTAQKYLTYSNYILIFRKLHLNNNISPEPHQTENFGNVGQGMQEQKVSKPAWLEHFLHSLRPDGATTLAIALISVAMQHQFLGTHLPVAPSYA